MTGWYRAKLRRGRTDSSPPAAELDRAAARVPTNPQPSEEATRIAYATKEARELEEMLAQA